MRDSASSQTWSDPPTPAGGPPNGIPGGKHLPLWQKTALLVAVVVTTFLLIMGMAAYAALRSQLSDHLTQSLNLQADRIARETQARLSGVIYSLDDLAGNTLIANGISDTAGRQTYLNPFLEDLDAVNGLPINILLVNHRGQPIAFNRHEAAEVFENNTPIIADAIETGQFRGRIIDVDGRPYFLGIEPLLFPRINSVEGALVYRFPVPGWQEASRYETDSLSFSLTYQPLPTEHPPNHAVLETSDTSLVWPPDTPDRIEGVLTTFDLTLPPDHNIGQLRVQGHAGAAVIAKPVAHITTIFLALAAVLLPITIIGAILLTRRMLSPLRELELLSRDIAANKTILGRLTRTGDDELGQVAAAFNHMIDELRDHQTNLESLVDRQTHSLKAEITERKEIEKALILAKNQSEIASRAKSELIANMSHELRTPLNAIIGFSECLQFGIKGPLATEGQAEYARLIHSSGQHLLSIINDILDVSAIEAGKLQFDEDWVDLKGIGDAVCVLVSARAKNGDVRLSNQIDEALPHLLCDERRIKQILLNLLTNAVKFTPEGGSVTLTATETAEGLALEVIDTGIGMDDTQIEVAMSVFGQVDSGLNRKSEGTGLGLPLTKGLIELHQGRLRVHSTPGKGTVVSVAFPKARLRYRSETFTFEDSPEAARDHSGGLQTNTVH